VEFRVTLAAFGHSMYRLVASGTRNLIAMPIGKSIDKERHFQGASLRGGHPG
jgi:hypothetical protein